MRSNQKKYLHGLRNIPDTAEVFTSLNCEELRNQFRKGGRCEFNHHLAGLFVVLGGLFILTQGAFTYRWPWTKYIWPSTFLLSGFFVLVWSDTELWPFGDRQWLEALQNNREVLQHKTFALLLLALACIAEDS